MSIISFSVSTYRRGALATGARRAPVPPAARAGAAAPRRGDRPARGGAVRDRAARGGCSCPCSGAAARATGVRIGSAQRLRAQVGRADRVGVVDDGGATRLVPADGQREAERQDEPDQPEQRALQHAERLAQMLEPVTEVAAEREADSRGAEDDREEDERELETAETKEHRTLLIRWPEICRRRSRRSRRTGDSRVGALRSSAPRTGDAERSAAAQPLDVAASTCVRLDPPAAGAARRRCAPPLLPWRPASGRAPRRRRPRLPWRPATDPA